MITETHQRGIAKIVMSMREIKFRGKNYGGIWLYGYLMPAEKPVINKGCKYRISVSPQACAGKDKMVYEVITDTIGQFTGLHDKNGKEIYEGDILIICEYENKLQDIKHTEVECELFTLDEIKGKLLQKYKSVIHYEDCTLFASELEGCSIYLASLAGDMRKSYPIFEYKVIGNIHDNPQLL